MTAGVPVLVMPIVMGVLMCMFGSLVAMLMTVMALGRPFVPVFVPMLVLGMAAHLSSLLSLFLIKIDCLLSHVN
jgi:hypothetical protein